MPMDLHFDGTLTPPVLEMLAKHTQLGSNQVAAIGFNYVRAKRPSALRFNCAARSACPETLATSCYGSHGSDMETPDGPMHVPSKVDFSRSLDVCPSLALTHANCPPPACP